MDGKGTTSPGIKTFLINDIRDFSQEQSLDLKKGARKFSLYIPLFSLELVKFMEFGLKKFFIG